MYKERRSQRECWTDRGSCAAEESGIVVFQGLGQVIGLVVAGPLYDLGGSQYPFGFGASVTLVMLLLVPYLARPSRSGDTD